MINKVFNPKTVAVIGATDRKMSVGRGLLENLQKEGSRKLFFVNPNKNKIFGKKTHARVTDIKEKIDLAVIVIPSKFVLSAVDDCISKKIKNLIIISSGFRETGKEGIELEKQLVAKIKENNINLVGPNTLGVIRPPKKLNLSFAPETPPSGDTAFISQSGGFIDALIDGSKDSSYGFSLIVSVGNEAGLTFADYIDMANDDKYTRSIALYVEGLRDGKEFYASLQRSSKPVIVIKAGKEDSSKKAIASHTGSLAGEHRIFTSAIKQAGAVNVDSLEELFNTAKLTAWIPPITKNVGIVTNGGGAGVLLADYFADTCIKLPKIKTGEGKKESVVLNNPLDILGDALTDKYEKASRAMLEQDSISALIVVQTPQIMTDAVANAKMLVALKKEYKKPIITIFMGQGESTLRAVKYLEKNKIPNFEDPQKVVKPLSAVVKK